MYGFGLRRHAGECCAVFGKDSGMSKTIKKTRSKSPAPKKVLPLQSGGWQLRPTSGQGPYTAYFNTFFPMKVEAKFYEFLRENIPIIDAAINRLVSLDGHIIVKGNNPELVAEIQDWIDNVQVNDIETGLQAFHRNISNEAFEQGFGLGEFVVDKKRSDIIGLRVADSKFITFKRATPDSGIDIYQTVTGSNASVPLNKETLMYFSINNENQNPYGAPLMRSCEFAAKILKTMQNSLLNVWERFGDPSYSIIYKTSKRDGTDLAARRAQIETEFNTAIRAKREGKSADFVRAIDSNSEITIAVIGAQGELLEFEVPSRHVMEQIVSKSGLAPWMLGMHWSTTERLSNAEAELILSEVVNRQASKMPLFNRLIKTLLLLRSRTWNPGEWWLEWAQVNLHDIVAQAQARFMNAQADMYDAQNAALQSTPAPATTPKSQKGARLLIMGQKELNRPTPWPELDKVEAMYEETLKSRWKDLQDRVMMIAKVERSKSYMPDKTYSGRKEDLPALMCFSLRSSSGRRSWRHIKTGWGSSMLTIPILR